MNTQSCKTIPRNKRHFYAPSFGNILKEMMHSSPNDIVFKKNIEFNKPLVNVSQDQDNYTLEMALPGISKKDVVIAVDESLLTISANLEKKEDKNYRLREFDYSVFSRKFQLPKDADAENISAVFSKGILTISLVKKEKIQKTIAVK